MEVYSSGFTKSRSKTKKVIVLDLDETIGSFGELYLLWTNVSIEKNQKNFNDIFDLYP